MLKKYKRLAAIILTVLMTLSLAACGSNNTGSSDATPTGKGSTEVVSDNANATASNTELKMIFWDSNQEAGLVAMADAFMKQNSDIKVTVETVPWDEYWTKLQASAISRLSAINGGFDDSNRANGNLILNLQETICGRNRNNRNKRLI